MTEETRAKIKEKGKGPLLEGLFSFIESFDIKVM